MASIRCQRFASRASMRSAEAVAQRSVLSSRRFASTSAGEVEVDAITYTKNAKDPAEVRM